MQWGGVLTQLLESAVCFGEEPATLVLLETAPADPTVHPQACHRGGREGGGG